VSGCADFGSWRCHDWCVSGVEVVGRDAELGSVVGFLDRAAAAPTALVLEGEPGIGKSTLWRAAVAAARRRGLTVLSSRPAESERGLAYAGLGDLFDPVVDVVIGELSPPRRRALEVALLRDEPTDGAVDRRALAVAVRDVLSLLSERKPVVVAIDDVQWLDASSASALAFALRRLDGVVRLVVARRLAASELEQAVDVERLRIGPVDHLQIRDSELLDFVRFHPVYRTPLPKLNYINHLEPM